MYVQSDTAALRKKRDKKFQFIEVFNGWNHSPRNSEISRWKFLKLICYCTGPRGNISDRFETIYQSKERLKIYGLEVTAKRIAKTWFIKEEKSKYFYLCDEAGKQASMKATDNGFVTMKNWDWPKNLKNFQNETLIMWEDQDKAYNFTEVKTLNKNIPNSDLKTINGCSHNVHLERPDEFNIIVQEFLNRN